MRPTPTRINRTPSRMRANNYFLRRTMTQKISANAIHEAQSLPELDKAAIQENTKIKPLNAFISKPIN